MGLLFVGGVMHVLWIAAITVFVFLEKVLPVGAWSGGLGWVAGIGLKSPSKILSSSQTPQSLPTI